MTATAFLLELREAGVVLSVDGDRLRVRVPPSAAIEQIRQRITARKAELITALAETSQRWRLRHADGTVGEALGAPRTHAQVLADYPNAIDAQPLSERATHPATHEEAIELRRLIFELYGERGPDEVEQFVAQAIQDAARALACFRSIAARLGLSMSSQGDAP